MSDSSGKETIRLGNIEPEERERLHGQGIATCMEDAKAIEGMAPEMAARYLTGTATARAIIREQHRKALETEAGRMTKERREELLEASTTGRSILGQERRIELARLMDEHKREAREKSGPLTAERREHILKATPLGQKVLDDERNARAKRQAH